MKPVTILEFPSNLGLKMLQAGHEPGVKLLPAWLRSHNFHDQIGPLEIIREIPPPYSGKLDEATMTRNHSQVIRYASQQEKIVRKVMGEDHFPLILGGDCSILIGNMLALKKTGRYGLFYLDGHTDFVLPKHSSTGGIAGMDLAIVTGNGPETLTDIEHQRPYVEENDVWCVGNREYDPDYVQLILDSGIHYFDLQHLRSKGAGNCVAEFLLSVETKSLDGFLLHIDVDVLNDAIMPAVDSRTPDGLHYSEFVEILTPLLSHPLLSAIEITILDPELDPDGIYTRNFVQEFTRLFRSGSSPTSLG